MHAFSYSSFTHLVNHHAFVCLTYHQPSLICILIGSSHHDIISLTHPHHMLIILGNTFYYILNLLDIRHGDVLLINQLVLMNLCLCMNSSLIPSGFDIQHGVRSIVTCLVSAVINQYGKITSSKAITVRRKPG